MRESGMSLLTLGGAALGGGALGGAALGRAALGGGVGALPEQRPARGQLESMPFPHPPPRC